MGQAKRRGTYEQRREEAERIGKMPFRSKQVETGEFTKWTQHALGLYEKRPDGWRRVK
jgi:hypothetical protein